MGLREFENVKHLGKIIITKGYLFISMQEKIFLRRKLLIYVNAINIAIFLIVLVIDLWSTKDRYTFQGAYIVYTILFGAGTYFFTIYLPTIEHLLYSIYLDFSTFLLIFILVFIRFLFHFKAKEPYAVLFGNIPIILIGCELVLTACFIAVVRKYLVQGLISPISIQREKGIELAIVLVRREYPEVFQ